METYYFEFNSGYIGGLGVVVAKSKKEALMLANEAISKEPLSKQKEPLTEKDLIQVKLGATVILSGDY